jgi:ferredoxin
MADPIQPPTPADRLALALCKFCGKCEAACPWCRKASAAVAHELAAILRERHGGSSQVADFLDGVGAHP